MSALLLGSSRPAGRVLRVVAWGLAAVALGTLAATAAEGADATERARMMRYVGILASAAMAVGVLHALYPSERAARLQLANPSPARLLRHQLERWMPLSLLLAVPASVIAGGDGLLTLEGVGSMLAVGLFAFARTAGLGPVVRAWEREEAGATYRAIYRTAPQIRFQVPDPMVPGLLRTAEVFVAGAVLSIAGEAVGTGWATLVAPALLLAGAIALTLRLRPTFDRAFWTSHGVWADAFRQVEQIDGREPLAVDAVYWAPRALRPTVWAGLVSMDRRLPLGRIAALGLAIAAIAHLAGAGAEVGDPAPGADGGMRQAGAAALALVVLGLNAAIALTADDRLLPAETAARLGGALRWTVARFLMAVRWLPPVVAVLLVLVWLADLSWPAVAGWTVAYLVASAVAAVLVTSVARARLRRALA